MLTPSDLADNPAPATKALIVEDEATFAWGLEQCLRHLGCEVEVAHTLTSARAVLLRSVPHLILLDLMLPDGDGADIIRDIRSNGYPTAVIVVSAKGSVEDKVRLLQSGASDYLAKPFALSELEARVQVQLRRPVAQPQTRPATAIPLPEFSRMEASLIEYMLAHVGTIVSREDLLCRVWGHKRATFTRTIDTHMWKLRRKLEALSYPVSIRAIPRRGYVLNVLNVLNVLDERPGADAIGTDSAENPSS